MVLIQYQHDQVGPAYSFRMVVTDQREAEYLFHYGIGSLQVVVESAGDFMNDTSSKYMNYESACSGTALFASILPDLNSSNDNSEMVYASLIVHFQTGDPYSTPVPLSFEMASSNEPKWWTATILRGQMLPNEKLEKVLRFDFCTGNQVDPVPFQLISEYNDILPMHEDKLTLLQVDIPSIGCVMNQADTLVDPVVILPIRQKKKCRISKSKNSAPMLREPDLNLQMFDESLVLLPTKH